MSAPELTELTVLFDFKDPYSYLALRPTLELIKSLKLQADWQPLLIAPMKAVQKPAADADRGAWHRWHRACYYELDLQRSANAQELPARHFFDGGLYRGASAEQAACGFLWMKAHCPARLEDYLRAVFRGYWNDSLGLDDASQITGQIAEAIQDSGVKTGDFSSHLELNGASQLATQQELLRAQGYFNVPGYVLGEDVYYGRQHLPMVRWILEGKLGQVPI